MGRLRPSQTALSTLAASAFAWWLAAMLIVGIGAAFRFYALDWDQPEGATSPIQLHPDERFISFVTNDIDWPGFGSYFDTANSPLNPYNADKPSFVYGTLPVFVTKAVSTLAGDDPSGPGNSYGNNVVWGRNLTAAIDTATILLVIALGTVLFSRAAGLAGGAAYALAVFPIQLAHFWTVDPWVTFFATAALLCSALAVRAERGSTFAIAMLTAGLAVGLGLACKVTAFPIALAPALAVAIRMGLRDFPGLSLRWAGQIGLPGHHGRRVVDRGAWLNDIAILCLAAWIAILAFRIAQPYAFTGPDIWDMTINSQWLDDLQRERALQSPLTDYPPFVQFADDTPYLTPIKNIVLWGLGPALGLAGWTALAAAAFFVVKRRELTFLMPVALAAAVFLFQADRIVAFMRYFAPMYPVVALLAGWAAVSLWNADWSTLARGAPARLRNAGQRVRLSAPAATLGARAVVVIVAAATAWWALAFTNVYREEHPRIAASEWIYENLEPGASITSEIWDDALPLDLPAGARASYVEVALDPYRTDSIETIRQLIYGVPEAETATGLDDADYIAISSHRIRDSVINLEREYPATIRYYELLESGQLGFEEVAHFTSRPSFLGISIDDSSAEEAFTVYDHPEVTIYQKTDAWDPDAAFALLMQAHPERAVNLTIGQGGTNGLQFTAEEAEAQQSGGTFADIVDGDGFFSQLPALWWLLWLQLPALAVVPALTWLLRATPDRGYGLSKLIGLAAVVVPTWLLVAWGFVDFSGTLAWTIWGAVLVAGLGSGFLLRTSLLAAAKERWRSWLTLEAIFLGVFALFLLFRWWNPDLWHPFRGGEKPMELAYLTAVIRSTQLPPFDPWFAGGSMNYYYMGWFFVAVPVRALQILPEVAFNLAVPTFAALTAVTGAATAHNLVGLAPRFAQTARRAAPPIRPALFIAVLGALLLVGIGNLDAGHQTIERFQAVNTWGLWSGVPVLGGAVGILGGFWNATVEGAQLPPFDWWRSSRVHIGSFDITEFPYWTFLFADLHPHLMGLPFFGGVIALGAAYVASVHRGLRIQPWILAAALGVAVALVHMVHTWDFPTAILLTAAAIAVGQLYARGRADLRFWQFVAHGAIAAAFLLLPFVPYTARFETFETGLMLAPETTRPNQYLAHFGIFVFIATAFLVVRYVEVLRHRRPGMNLPLTLVGGRWEAGAMVVFIIGLSLFTWVIGVTVVLVSALIVAYLLNLLWLEWRAPDRDTPRILATALFALAFAIAAGVDVVTIKNDIVRMNTVFKFSLQAWQLFALASAYASWYVLAALWQVRGLNVAARPNRRLAASTVSLAGAVLVFAGLLYPLSGTPPRLTERFSDAPRGLNGFAYLESGSFVEDLGTTEPVDDLIIATERDAALVDWLRENVQGSPVIAEAVGPLYHWNGRISMLTGLPTVIGWDWHQTQQRWTYGNLIQRRFIETQLFYELPDTIVAEQYLLTYNVRYVVVGALERAHGTPEGIAKLATMPGLTEAFRNGDDVIYEVNQPLLLESAIATATTN